VSPCGGDRPAARTLFIFSLTLSMAAAVRAARRRRCGDGGAGASGTGDWTAGAAHALFACWRASVDSGARCGWFIAPTHAIGPAARAAQVGPHVAWAQAADCARSLGGGSDRAGRGGPRWDGRGPRCGLRCGPRCGLRCGPRCGLRCGLRCGPR
jgi:hypothetical protein